MRPLVCLLLTGLAGGAQGAPLVKPSLAYTVSAPDPARQVYHVVFRTSGLGSGVQDFKLPAWSPGYYALMPYTQAISGFSAVDGAGRALSWEKTAPNTWRVAVGRATQVVLAYDVKATVHFAVNSFLDENRGFIAPASLFMHPVGALKRASTVTLDLPKAWRQVATGLDRAPGGRPVFRAPDYDTLYDCPILMGNQERHTFDVRGIPHHVVIEAVPAEVDRTRMLADLKGIVEAAVKLMGDLPYRHYTFQLMGQGRGGVEHLNSAACAFRGEELRTEGGYKAWLSFIAHEYFHHFNVKRIRPLALGPFDYDRQNRTSMLWVSEGLTVHYESQLLLRAGLLSREAFLEGLARNLASFLNMPGHRYQSAAEASTSAWEAGALGGDRRVSISYYDNGRLLGTLLDLAIRHRSGDRKSLDDVMRSLYRDLAVGQQRGFTNAEFRATCERMAGADLSDVFACAETPRVLDLTAALAHAGLALAVEATPTEGTELGLHAQADGAGGWRVVDLEPGSAAQKAGVRPGDVLRRLEGGPFSPDALEKLLEARHAGDALDLTVRREGGEVAVHARLEARMRRTCTITPNPGCSEAERALREGWLRSGEAGVESARRD